MSDPQKNLIKIDPGTVVFIVFILLLLPLLSAGFFWQ